MDLDLGLDIESLISGPAPGPAFEVLGPVREADLAALSQKRTSAPAYLERQKLSERHHALAKALASGMEVAEAAAFVGYAAATVHLLKNSPAFVELVAVYRGNADAEFAGLAAQFAGLTKDALLELRTRLEEEPEGFSHKMLLEVLTKSGDRAGFAPVQRSEVAVNVSLGEKLAAARRRVESAMIDVTPNADS